MRKKKARPRYIARKLMRLQSSKIRVLRLLLEGRGFRATYIKWKSYIPLSSTRKLDENSVYPTTCNFHCQAARSCQDFIKLSRRVTLARDIFASQTLLTATSASRFDSKGEEGSIGLSREILESLDPRFLAELYGILR